jgi:hypothetical protein
MHAIAGSRRVATASRPLPGHQATMPLHPELPMSVHDTTAAPSILIGVDRSPI